MRMILAAVVRAAPWGAVMAVLSLCFGAGVALWAGQPVSARAWWGLYGLCLLALPLLATWSPTARLKATTWLAVAAYAALFAAMFWGANIALDALHGPRRRVSGVTAALGGLELWFALCPGVVAVALGMAVGAARRPRF